MAGTTIRMSGRMSTPRSFRISDEVVERIDEIRHLTGRARSEVVEIAVTHLLATITRGRPVYMTLLEETPSADDKPAPSPGGHDEGDDGRSTGQ